jgi:hypothetical protein
MCETRSYTSASRTHRHEEIVARDGRGHICARDAKRLGREAEFAIARYASFSSSGILDKYPVIENSSWTKLV